MTILPQQTDGGNYAAERLVGQQVIDPTLAASVDRNGWVYHFRRRAEEAEKMVEVQTAARNAAEANYESLATAFSGEQQLAQEVREDYEYTLEVITELNQGCSWLAEALRDTQEKLAAKRHNMAQENRLHKLEIEEMGVWVDNAQDYGDDMDQGCSDLARRCQEAEALADENEAYHLEVMAKRDELQSRLDVALAELATLKAERKQEDETIGPVLRRALNQRDHYARERDDLVKSVLLWSAEADRAQREVIAVADGAAQLRSVILTLDGELHWQPEQCVWVLKEATGDALRTLAIQLRGIDQGGPFRDAA